MDLLFSRFRRHLEETDVTIHRFIFDEIDWSQRLIGIKGQRGVGKTTLMLQRILEEDPEGSHSFYISLDNLWLAEHSLMDLVESLVKRNITHLYLDEVHKLPGWERYIKNIYDSYPEIKVVFTGSSLLVIDHSVADLSRRVSMHLLPGLSFREFLMFEGLDPLPKLTLQDVLFSHETIAASISSRMDVLKYFKKYMAVGYYPFYRTMKKEDYYGRIQNMVSAVIDSDIPAVEKKIDYETLIKAKRLVGIIAGSQPYQPNLTTLSGLMSTNRAQLLKLFDLLDRAGIIRQLFGSSTGPAALGKPQKVLLDNPAEMNALSPVMIGAERECVFASFLTTGHKVSFAKDGDFIVDGRYLFEIGGRKKGFSQIKDIPDSFAAADGIEFGFGNKIPLWLFGLLY